MRNNSSVLWFGLGALVLAPVDILLSNAAGRSLGFEGAELFGYSLSPAVTTLLIVGLCCLSKRARTRAAISKIVLITLLFFLVTTAGSLLQQVSKLSAISTEIDPASLNVDQAKAILLASQIKDSVQNGQPSDLQTLYDADRFIKKVLRGQDMKARYLQSLAQGGSKSFAQNRILDQMATMVKAGGEFDFVKLYKRDGEPILQFRLTEESGVLHYLDLYIYKAAGDKLRIDDFRFYDSGDSLSKQIIARSTGLDTSSFTGDQIVGLEALQNVVTLAQQGKVEEAAAILDSLPDDVTRQRTVMRLRLQLANRSGSPKAEQLMSEFKERFPDDPSIVFSAFAIAAAKDDLAVAAALLDDIYQIVDRDDFLLWYKVRLFVGQKNYSRAIASLSEMETRYGIDVPSLAESELDAEFLSSNEYRVWLRERKRRRPV